MTRGVCTWEDLGPLHGNVLLVVNSTPSDQAPVGDVLKTLKSHASGDALHVIAPPEWGERLAGWGIGDDRVLLAADEDARELELNYFLETPRAIRWIVPKRFRAILGSSAHNLYNEEIKDVFEQRVTLLLGDGCFLAHTLPCQYVYVFDLAGLLRRFGREWRRQDYRQRCRSLVEECHQLWRAQGAPAESEDSRSADVLHLLGRHFGVAIVAFDEAAPAPLERPDGADTLVQLVTHLRDLVHRRDEEMAERAEAVKVREAMLARLQAERNEAVRIRDEMLDKLRSERIDAVAIRDAIIDDLRRKHARLTRGWRRWIVGRD